MLKEMEEELSRSKEDYRKSKQTIKELLGKIVTNLKEEEKLHEPTYKNDYELQ